MDNVTAIERADGGWTRERVDLVKRTICPKGISDDEFALFIEQCKRSGLDPLLKEAFCVARRANVGDKNNPKWVTKYEFQPSEAGMLARAERFPDFRGIQASAVFAEDAIEVDMGAGQVRHAFNPAKRKGSLVGGWARLVRHNHLPVVVWLDFSGYVQQSPLWSKIPTTMIEKCARVAALRKAYPEAFGGMYVKEEMPADEFVDAGPTPMQAALAVVPPSPALPEPRPVVESVPRFTGAVGDFPPDPPMQSGRIEHRAEVERVVRATGGTVEAVTEAGPKQVEAPAKVMFGSLKGRVIGKLDEAQVSAALSEADAALQDAEKQKWWPAIGRQRVLLLERLDAVTQPEVGANG